MNTANGGDILFHFKGDASNLNSSTKNLTKSILTATGVTKALSAGFKMISDSMDSAISRYDTMNNFPRVMSNLGIASDDAEKSIAKMNKALIGLPTTLDQGAMAVQRFTSANGDVEKSTELFLAVNNAILAGGASAEIQASALEQISQAYAKGKPDMLEWRTLMTAMPAQLKQVATAMGYVSSAELGEAVREDSAEFERMMNTIVQLNSQGVDGLANFEEQARGATNGISTAMKNMRSRIADGVSEMITAVNEGLEENGLGGIAPMLEQIGSSIRDFLTDMAPTIVQVVSFVAQYLPPIISFLKGILPILLPIFASLKAYEITLGVIKTATMLWNTAQMILNGTMLLNPVGLVVAGIVLLIGIIILLWNKCEWFRNLVTGLWNGMVSTIKTAIDKIKKFPETMGKIGSDIVRGIANGITNGFGFIKDTIKRFVGNVTDFIKKMFKIGSPSKLMSREIGQWIPKGISVGISANADSVYDSMKEMEKSVVDSFQLSPNLANSLHYSPNVIVNNQMNMTTDPLGQVVGNIKTFAGGAKNDYNYGMGV